MSSDRGPCPQCGRPLVRDYGTSAKYPPTVRWAPYEIAMCAEGHAWRRWVEEPLTTEAWSEEPGWHLRRTYRKIPDSTIRARLPEILREAGVRPLHKSDKFDDIVDWVLAAAPFEDPRMAEAVEIAEYWRRWRRVG